MWGAGEAKQRVWKHSSRSCRSTWQNTYNPSLPLCYMTFVTNLSSASIPTTFTACPPTNREATVDLLDGVSPIGTEQLRKARLNESLRKAAVRRDYNGGMLKWMKTSAAPPPTAGLASSSPTIPSCPLPATPPASSEAPPCHPPTSSEAPPCHPPTSSEPPPCHPPASSEAPPCHPCHPPTPSEAPPLYSFLPDSF